MSEAVRYVAVAVDSSTLHELDDHCSFSSEHEAEVYVDSCNENRTNPAWFLVVVKETIIREVCR